MVRQMMKTLIVDDEPIARQVLREELGLLPEVLVVGEAENGKQALQRIVDLQPDLVFLDLQMPVMGGFEVVRNISGARIPAIVIVTAFNEHAVEAFEAGAIDYLMKPVRGPRLQTAVDRAKKLLGKPLEIAERLARIASVAESSNQLTLKKIVGRIGREYFLLDMDEVIAFQAEGEVVWIVTSKRRFLATQTLRTLEADLSQAYFQRVHRNAIVNVQHVRQISPLTSNRWLLTLGNEQQLIVSKRQAHNVRQLLQR